MSQMKTRMRGLRESGEQWRSVLVTYEMRKRKHTEDWARATVANTERITNDFMIEED